LFIVVVLEEAVAKDWQTRRLLAGRASYFQRLPKVAVAEATM
jgi:hypothetical protein